MTTRLSRRTVLKGAAAGAAVAGFPYVVRAQEKTLNVFTYAGGFESTLRDHLVPSFEERTGAKVVLHAGWWDMLPKLQASPPGEPVYDLVMTDPTQGMPAIQSGLFQNVDLSQIPNTSMMPQRLRDDWYQANNWGVNLSGSPMVIALNSETVSAPPAHWHDLLSDPFKGNISMYNAPYQSLYAFAQMKAGEAGNLNGGYDELKNDLDAVLQYAADHKDIVRLWWQSSGDFMEKMFQKEVLGGIGHGTGPFQADAEGKPVTVVVPEEGTAIVQVFWSVTEGAAQPELAHQFINDFYSTEFQVKWGTVPRLAVENVEAAAMAAEQDEIYAKYLPASEADWNKISYYPYDIYFADGNWDKINDFWEREVLR